MKHIQNCRESWATHLSHKFDAAARLMAVSGKGVLHNAYGVPGPKMGNLYSRITDHSKPHSYQYQDGIIPDAIFYFIGSNDYSHPLPPDAPFFVNAYKEMLQSSLWNLKQSAPEAKPLLICVGAKENSKSKRMNANIQRAVKEFSYAYKWIHYVEVPHSAFAK
jgi:lysophospholipase L1-like esterase